MSAQVYEFKTREQFEKDRFRKIKHTAEAMAISFLNQNDKPMPAEYGWFIDAQRKLEENPRLANDFTEKEMNAFIVCSEYHIVLTVLSLSYVPELLMKEKMKK